MKKRYPVVENFHTSQSEMMSIISTVLLFAGTTGLFMVPDSAPSIVMLAVGGFSATMAKPIMAFGYNEAMNPGRYRSGRW